MIKEPGVNIETQNEGVHAARNYDGLATQSTISLCGEAGASSPSLVLIKSRDDSTNLSEEVGDLELTNTSLDEQDEADPAERILGHKRRRRNLPQQHQVRRRYSVGSSIEQANLLVDLIGHTLGSRHTMVTMSSSELEACTSQGGFNWYFQRANSPNNDEEDIG